MGLQMDLDKGPPDPASVRRWAVLRSVCWANDPLPTSRALSCHPSTWNPTGRSRRVRRACRSQVRLFDVLRFFSGIRAHSPDLTPERWPCAKAGSAFRSKWIAPRPGKLANSQSEERKRRSGISRPGTSQRVKGLAADQSNELTATTTACDVSRSPSSLRKVRMRERSPTSGVRPIAS